jgi:hypothetical protein
VRGEQKRSRDTARLLLEEGAPVLVCSLELWMATVQCHCLGVPSCTVAAVRRSGSVRRRCGKWLYTALRAELEHDCFAGANGKVSIARALTASQSRRWPKHGERAGAAGAPRAGDADLDAEPAAAAAGAPAPAPGPGGRAGRRLHRHQGAELRAAAGGRWRRVQPIQARGAAGRLGRRRRARAVAAGGHGPRLARVLHAVGAPAQAPAGACAAALWEEAGQRCTCWPVPILAH